LGLFNGHFLEAKAFYAQEFDAVSCVSFIGDIDTSKAFTLINDMLQSEIVTMYQHSYYDHNEQCMFFNNTLFVLTNQRMIELGNNWCQVLHTQHQFSWANDLIKSLSAFRIVNNEPVIGFARRTAAN
jgi:virulence-associated protein VapD